MVGWESPERLGVTSARVEVFCDDPDTFIARAVEAGADGRFDCIRDHQAPWGVHRQGGFIDPFGHIWTIATHVEDVSATELAKRMEGMA